MVALSGPPIDDSTGIRCESSTDDPARSTISRRESCRLETLPCVLSFATCAENRFVSTATQSKKVSKITVNLIDDMKCITLMIFSFLLISHAALYYKVCYHILSMSENDSTSAVLIVPVQKQEDENHNYRLSTYWDFLYGT